MKRRTFIASTALATTSLLAAACSRERQQPGDGTDRSGALPNASDGGGGDWQGVREQFNLSRDKIHMSALLVAANPSPVREAIERYRRALDEDPAAFLEAENDQRKADVRAAAAAYLGGRPEEIALTDSTTMGIALVYHGLPLRPGDEILTTEHDYYATHETLRQVANRTGATVRHVALFDRPEDADADEMVERLTRAITPSTRALALTWVHSGTGVKVPIAQVSQAVAGINQRRSAADRLLVCVDGVHGFGVEDAGVDELGCDFFMAGCHKWLFGPRGTGIVWGREDAWARLRPMIPSFMDTSSWSAWARGTAPPGPTTAARMSPGGFKAFEHQWAMADAFAFHEEIGKARISERTHELGAQLKEGLAEMPHIRLVTPRAGGLSAGIVCFEVDGRSPEDVVEALGEQDIVASTTPYGVSYPRLTPSIYNTPGEVDAALRALRALG